MKAKKSILVIACMFVLCLALAACGGNANQQSGDQKSGDEAKSEAPAQSGETTEEKIARYTEGYDTMSGDFTISNPNKLNYDYVCATVGDDGVWVYEDESSHEWLPLDGTPAEGEEAALLYSVEGENGGVLVLWSKGKDYKADTFSSISNTFDK